MMKCCSQNPFVAVCEKRGNFMEGNNKISDKHSPLNWLVNVLHLMLQATTVLVEDIDQQLQVQGSRFHREKKQYIKNYARCVEQAGYWMDKFGLDASCWEAVGKDGRAYSNVIADANELIRLVMLYVDRAHSEDGYYKIFRFLRSLPENGLFPEWYIGRFQMHHVWILGKGDRVKTLNHGNGTLEDHLGNGNWQVLLDSGERIILNENKHFKIF
jgi:hypothetical protein